MIRYNGTTQKTALHGNGNYATDTLNHAVIMAALRCHEESTSIRDAVVRKLSVESYMTGSITIRGSLALRRIYTSVCLETYTYEDLRSRLDQSGWSLLHAKPNYLQRLTDNLFSNL